MADRARVKRIDDLDDVHVALVEFEEEVRGTLGGIEMEVRRALSWLKQDRMVYWSGEIKRARLDIAEARSQLSRKRISTASGPPKDTVEKELVRDAQRRLREAEAKVETIKRWIPVVEKAVGEYHGHSRPLGDMMAQEVPRMLAALKRMIQSIEAYSAISAPTAGRDLLMPGAAESASAAGAATAPAEEGQPEPPAAGPSDATD